MVSPLVRNGALAADSVGQVLTTIAQARDLGGISAADYVQESVTENLALRLDALRKRYDWAIRRRDDRLIRLMRE